MRPEPGDITTTRSARKNERTGRNQLSPSSGIGIRLMDEGRTSGRGRKPRDIDIVLDGARQPPQRIALRIERRQSSRGA